MILGGGGVINVWTLMWSRYIIGKVFYENLENTEIFDYSFQTVHGFRTVSSIQIVGQAESKFR